MDIVLNLVWLIPLLPLLATAIITFVRPVYLRKKVAARLTIGLMAVSLVLAVAVFAAVLATPVAATPTPLHYGAPAAEHGAALPGEGAEGEHEAAAGEHGATAPAGEGGACEVGHEELCLPQPATDLTDRKSVV